MKLTMISQFSKISLISTAILTILTGTIATPQQGLQCLFGGLLISANIIVVIWVSQQIFFKKSIALAIAVIVSKYAILLSLFVLIYRQGWRLTEGFMVGLLVMFPALYGLAHKHLRKSEKNDSL